MPLDDKDKILLDLYREYFEASQQQIALLKEVIARQRVRLPPIPYANSSQYQPFI